MTTPVESLKDSIRQTVSSLRRDAPAARFIGEQVVKMLGRSIGQKLNRSSHSYPRQNDADKKAGGSAEKQGEESAQGAVPSKPVSQNEVLPWTQYDMMSARDIVSRLKVSPPELCLAVYMYEIGHRARATVLAASEARGADFGHD
ncbi:MAG: hypothetical protein ACKOI2_14450 [Actinomycetota bacterium]